MAKKKLSEYRAKRDFKRTKEPSGQARVRGADYPRFVIQKHDATRLHYDLRLEMDGVFKSWAVTKGPSLDPRDKRLAVEVEDHPLDYGDFEGVIPEGEYGAGTVEIWDSGTYEAESWAENKIVVRFKGKRCRGRYALLRMNGKNWIVMRLKEG